MSRSDYDHVEGVSRCSCGRALPETIICRTCGESGVTPPDKYGNRDRCPDCEIARDRLEEGECPDGCLDEYDDPRNEDGG